MNTDDVTTSPGAPTLAVATAAEPRRTMVWWTSGIDSTTDAGLAAGGVKRVLGDPVSLPYMSIFFPDREIALDSGAYRNFKNKKRRITTEQDARLYSNLYPDRKFAFRIAMDVLGDAETTMLYWNKVFYGHERGFVPVFQWGGPEEHLQQYLEQAPWVHAVHTNLVAIGGLAPILRGGHRTKDKAAKAKLDRRRDEVIEQILILCERYPNRFHILGLNHLDTINRTRHLVASADASKWLDGRRYGYVFFIDTRTGRLRYAPSGAIKEYAEMSTSQRLTHNARIIAAYAQHERKL